MQKLKYSPILFTVTILTTFSSKTLRFWVICHKLKTVRCEKSLIWRKVCKSREKNIFWALFFRQTAIQFRKEYDESQNHTIRHGSINMEAVFKAIRWEQSESSCLELEPFWVRSGLAGLKLEHLRTFLCSFWMTICLFATKQSFGQHFWDVLRHIQVFQ